MKSLRFFFLSLAVSLTAGFLYSAHCSLEQIEQHQAIYQEAKATAQR